MLLRFYASVGRSRLGIIVVLRERGGIEELRRKQVNNIKNLALKVIHTGGVNAYVMTLSFLLVLVTARIYGPEQRGYLALITVWVALSSLAAGLSLGQVAMHRVTKFGGGEIARLLADQLFNLAVSFGLAAMLSLSLIGHLPTTNSLSNLPKSVLFSGLFAIPFMILEQYFKPLLICTGNIKAANNSLAAGRTFGFVLAMVAALGWGLPIWTVVMSVTAGQMVVSLLMLRNFGKSVASQRRTPNDTVLSKRRLISDGFKLHMNAIGAVLINSSGVLVLGQYSNSSEVAFYQLALQLLNTILVLPQAVATVLGGRVAELGVERSWVEYRKICTLTIVAMFLLAALSGMVAPFLIKGVVGEDFEPAINIFKLMLLGCPGITLSILMGPQWIARGFFVHASVITSVIGVTAVFTSIWCAKNVGEVGVVYAFLATWALSVLGNGAMFIYCEIRHRYKPSVSEYP